MEMLMDRRDQCPADVVLTFLFWNTQARVDGLVKSQHFTTQGQEISCLEPPGSKPCSIL